MIVEVVVVVVWYCAAIFCRCCSMMRFQHVYILCFLTYRWFWCRMTSQTMKPMTHGSKISYSIWMDYWYHSRYCAAIFQPCFGMFENQKNYWINISCCIISNTYIYIVYVYYTCLSTLRCIVVNYLVVLMVVLGYTDDW